MSPGLSHALEELVRRRDQLKSSYETAIRAHRNAAQRASELENDLKREWATNYLKHRASHEEGARPLPETDAKARADLDTDRLHREWVIAKAVRASAEEALKTWRADMEFLEALAHAHNRELRTLGG